MAEKNDKPADYTVGFGRPPKSGQFKPGQSGNPSGKKKGKSVADYLAEVGEQEKTFTQGGAAVTMPANEALAQKLYSEALKGKPQFAKMVLDAEKGAIGGLSSGDGVLIGPEEFKVAGTNAEWLKLIKDVTGGGNDDVSQ